MNIKTARVFSVIIFVVLLSFSLKVCFFHSSERQTDIAVNFARNTKAVYIDETNKMKLFFINNDPVIEYQNADENTAIMKMKIFTGSDMEIYAVFGMYATAETDEQGTFDANVTFSSDISEITIEYNDMPVYPFNEINKATFIKQ